MKVKFVVPGEPQGKGRPRFSRAGEFIRTYTPEKTANYENLIKVEYQRQCLGRKFPDGTPLDMRITAYYSIPKSASKKKRAMMLQHRIRPMKKADWDNIGKIVCDALNGLAFHDDAQVVDAQVRKFYSEDPRVVVTIQEATEPQYFAAVATNR